MPPDVSIIIPVRGYEPWLIDTLISLRNASRRKFEVLVIDRPDNDGLSRTKWTVAITRAFDWLDVEWIRQDNGWGKAGAMNQGARLASSDVLFFLDADCWVRGGVVDEALGLLERADIVGVLRRHTELGFSVLTEPLVKRLGFPTPWACMMRRSTLETYGGWRYDYLEDVDFWLRARENGCRILYTTRRVNLMRRVRKEWPKFFHLLKHMVHNPHTHEPA